MLDTLFNKIKNYSIWIFLVIVVAFLLRFQDITTNPAGFFCDEASNGYNAYTIWNSGKDEYGVPFPVYFKTFGEYRNPIMIYSMAPIVGLFGLNELSVRMTSLLYGLLAIVAVFLFTSHFFNKKVALIAALLLAISPWHIHFSRFGDQMITSVFWVTLSFYLLGKATRLIVYYPFALLSLIVSFLSYFTPRMYLPLLVILFLIVYHRETRWWYKNTSFWIYSLTAVLLIGKLIFPSMIDGTFFARWSQVEHQAIEKSEILKAYLNHFSIDYLFEKGDVDFPRQFITRHSIRGIGQLYWFQLPLLFFSFQQLIKKNKHALFIFLWILIYPLGSSFTTINPQATRSIIGVVPLQILSAVGLQQIFYDLKKNHYRKAVLIVFAFIIVFSVFHYLSIRNRYPLYSSDFWGWQFGPKSIMQYFLSEVSHYDQLCMEGKFNAPHIFLKFYDPENECAGKCQICDYQEYNPTKKQLFALSKETYYSVVHNTLDPVFVQKKVIFYPNGEEAFIIGKFK